MGQVIYANFQTHKIKKIVDHPTNHLSQARIAGRGGVRTLKGAAQHADRFMARHHTKLFYGGLALQTHGDYQHARHEHLNKRQAATVAGLGTSVALATHHATKRAGLGWKAGLATDVAAGAGTMYAQHRLVKHYQRKNRPTYARRTAHAGRF